MADNPLIVKDKNGADYYVDYQDDGTAITPGKQRVVVSGTVTVDPSGVTSPVSLASQPLPTGAATEATLSTINTAAQAIQTAVEIIDNAISGSQMQVDLVGNTVDTELPAAAALTDAFANPTAPGVGAFGMVWNGVTWDRAPGTAAGGLKVDLGTNNDVTVTGTVTANAGTGTFTVDPSGVTSPISAVSLPLPTGASTAANQSTGNSSLSSIDGKFTTTAAAADATANPTVTKVAGFGHVYNGTTWDRLRGNTVGAYAHGPTAHGATVTGNPIRTGGQAIAHGTNPTAVSAGQVSRHYTNRAGIPFVIGGHPNIKSAEYYATTAQTNDDMLGAIASGTKYIITQIFVATPASNSAALGVRIGFGATAVPTEPTDGNVVTGMVFSHPGIPAGSGGSRGNGDGIIGIGGDGEELRITTSAAQAVKVTVNYYTIES